MHTCLLKKEDKWRQFKLLGLVRYREDCCGLEESCCHSNPCERPSANADVKDSQKCPISLFHESERKPFVSRGEPVLPIGASRKSEINKHLTRRLIIKKEKTCFLKTIRKKTLNSVRIS